jgi:NAD(P)-dependent dehydrogenase (short-subunit alcohol dehydrogenase family)
MAGRLQGKVCIVTGSGRAIGRASALMFAREGARVVGADIAAPALTGRRSKRLEELLIARRRAA